MSSLVIAEASKAPFLILGGVLAVYAVVLSAIGISRPGFPYSDRGARLVMLTTLVGAVLAIGAVILTD
jgi:hypothetical protein